MIMYILQHAKVLQFDSRTTAEFESLLFFVQRFETLKLKLDKSII